MYRSWYMDGDVEAFGVCCFINVLSTVKRYGIMTSVASARILLSPVVVDCVA
jgi:hypothetical protein